MPSPMDDHQAISIVLTPDEIFEFPLSVLVHRLSHLHQQDGCRIFALHDNIPETARARVAACVRDPTTVEWVSVPADFFGECLPAANLPRASLFGLALTELLPRDVTRAIYLDIDTFPVAALTDLWRTDLGTSPVAAVRGAFMPWIGCVRSFPWRSLGIGPDAPYFNNGVMLVDLDAWG